MGEGREQVGETIQGASAGAQAAQENSRQKAKKAEGSREGSEETRGVCSPCDGGAGMDAGERGGWVS